MPHKLNHHLGLDALLSRERYFVKTSKSKTHPKLKILMSDNYMSSLKYEFLS